MDRDYIGACISCGQHFFKLRGGDEYKCARNSGAGYHWISDISLVYVPAVCGKRNLCPYFSGKKERQGLCAGQGAQAAFAFPFLYSVHRAPGFRAFHPGKRDPRSVCVPAGMGGVLYQGSSGNGAVLVPSAAVRFIRMFGGDQESGQKRTAVRAGRKMYAAHTAASVFPGACLRPNPVYRLYLPRGFVSASFSYGILCFLP